MIVVSGATCPQQGGWMREIPHQPRHGLVKRRCVCFSYPWEIWVFTTSHRLEESSVLCSQGNTLEEDSWEVIFLFQVVCGMESCEPLGEEKPNWGLLRYLCEAASSSELFTRGGDALKSLSTPSKGTQAGKKTLSRRDEGFLPIRADCGRRNLRLSARSGSLHEKACKTLT